MGAGCDGSTSGPPRELEPEVQTRNEAGELRFFHTLKAAFAHAEADPTVWKVSFPVYRSGERVRLVLQQGKWVYEDITTEVLKQFEREGVMPSTARGVPK